MSSTTSSVKTNIKTVILATIKAPLIALFNNIEAIRDSIFDHTEVQDDTISKLQIQVSELHEIITKVYTEILKYNDTVTDIQNGSFTREQLTAMTNRVRELSWISTQLYTIVYDLRNNGTSNVAMPDMDHPIVSRAELLAKYKEEHQIPPDQDLNPDQEDLFENYVTQWFINNPGHVLEETLEQS